MKISLKLLVFDLLKSNFGFLYSNFWLPMNQKLHVQLTSLTNFMFINSCLNRQTSTNPKHTSLGHVSLEYIALWSTKLKHQTQLKANRMLFMSITLLWITVYYRLRSERVQNWYGENLICEIAEIINLPFMFSNYFQLVLN